MPVGCFLSQQTRVSGRGCLVQWECRDTWTLQTRREIPTLDNTQSTRDHVLPTGCTGPKLAGMLKGTWFHRYSRGFRIRGQQDAFFCQAKFAYKSGREDHPNPTSPSFLHSLLIHSRLKKFSK